MSMVRLQDLPRDELSHAERLLVQGDLRKWVASLSLKQKIVLKYKWDFWARPDQLLPDRDDIDVFMPLGGRGSGKTKTGAETTHQWARNRKWHLALVGETAAEVRDVMVEGSSGLLATTKPWNPCEYQPSKRRVIWPNTGTWATLYSGDDPDQLRGPNTHKVWVDELAKFRYPQQCWDNIEMLNRMGKHPQIVVTTTPRPLPLIRSLVADVRTLIRKVSTFRNALNLAQTFLNRLLTRYVGTRLGRQELEADILSESDEALWKLQWLERNRVTQFPHLIRTIVGVDPPAGEITECGIVASGVNVDRTDCYTLADDSIAGTPDVWAKQVWATALKVNAHAIYAEQNQGGLMVKSTLNMVRPDDCRIPIELVTASDSKAVRAGPVAMLAEQGRDHHVGTFGLLEDELCNWEPNSKMPSPNRLDAKVWSVFGLGMVGNFREAFAL